MIANLASFLDRLKESFLIHVGYEQPFRIIEHLQHSPYEVCVLCQHRRSRLAISTEISSSIASEVGQTSFEDLGYFRLQACDISLGIIYRMSIRPRWIPMSIHDNFLGGIDHRVRNPLVLEALGELNGRICRHGSSC
jgi:hypothetical protein